MSDRTPGVSGPVVGIVGHGYVVARPFGDLPVTGTPPTYVEALAACGARPVLLPGGRASELLDLVDGLVLTGGGDLDPALHGGESGAAADVDRARDDAEIALVHEARRAGVPLLGVCRGLQVLAVAFGGSLAAGIGHRLPLEGHPVATAPRSLVRGLLGERVVTSALHDQAAVEVAPCWRPTAWADDGTVEAIEWAAGDWPALGVQWHPELTWHADLDDRTGPALFGWLREAAAMRAREPRARTLVRS
ncbi:gamma-glutamyl-gamma-aminobutyrate hydrolase family protein [Nocardioides pocheonensis]|uniref:Gamma-glutamyl-gamma-aminobutyrate hydrolase family protein n=1 Tax=Nocardioides pocheonensis TaxID=661485 RepID=A0A3N0GW52_9ACTN|nr:gamma-glutamyl-gamma-aminobutyrate hydrolase family protein [Nocardioides pocheonensis]RNM16380.1 gamma-glutamyl-gamma-aminobutyrate hydrolase family protein [Nocardioides pocheonensis]